MRRTSALPEAEPWIPADSFRRNRVKCGPPGQMEFAWGMVQRIVKAYDDFYSKNKRDKR